MHCALRDAFLAPKGAEVCLPPVSTGGDMAAWIFPKPPEGTTLFVANGCLRVLWQTPKTVPRVTPHSERRTILPLELGHEMICQSQCRNVEFPLATFISPRSLIGQNNAVNPSLRPFHTAREAEEARLNLQSVGGDTNAKILCIRPPL